MQNISSVSEYDPSLGKPLTPEDIDYLWDAETTKHIMTVQVINNKISGGHTTDALEEWYGKSENSDEESLARPITIDYVAETDYPGYYIYYIRSAQTYNGCVCTNTHGCVKFLECIKVKHAIDIKTLPIDEYFLDAKEALIGAVPVRKYNKYNLTGTNKKGIVFMAIIEKTESGWHLLTVFPLLKEKEVKLHKGM